jgi:hypothetical protein
MKIKGDLETPGDMGNDILMADGEVHESQVFCFQGGKLTRRFGRETPEERSGKNDGSRRKAHTASLVRWRNGVIVAKNRTYYSERQAAAGSEKQRGNAIADIPSENLEN